MIDPLQSQYYYTRIEFKSQGLILRLISTGTSLTLVPVNSLISLVYLEIYVVRK